MERTTDSVCYHLNGMLQNDSSIFLFPMLHANFSIAYELVQIWEFTRLLQEIMQVGMY